jgi:CheY-like chemotaxis protein
MNLCANAAYAMQEKNGTISIGLEPIRIGNEGLSVESGSLPAGRYAKLSVRDNGEGIPADILPRIFDPFFTTKPQGKGTGMGLAVVHGIVCSHGGGIRVVSKPGEGALFECYLPIAEAGQPPAGDSATTPVLPHGNGERIIVVDDEPMIVELLSQRLSRLGYRIEVFTSSTEALTHILEHPKSVDVLITDQTMPHLTGFELGLKVKNILPELPIIICTGYSDWLTPALILEKGFSAFFFKPVPTDQLAATLRTLLEKTPAAQQAETLR